MVYIYGQHCKNQRFRIHIYGSTTQPFKHRIDFHKRDNAITQIILKKEKYDYGIIERYPCNSNKELLLRERYWYDKCQNCFDVINLSKPVRTKEEKKQYRADFAERPCEREKRNKRKRDKHRWRWSWGRYEGKLWMWDNNMLDIDTSLFER